MTFREPRRAGQQSRAAIALVARALTALVFTFYVNYTPFHLLSTRHLDDALSSAQLAALHFEDHDDGDHDGHHTPHPASDHSLQILPTSESFVFCVIFLPAVTSVVLEAPASPLTVSFVERIWPPGESPPEPSQPRAPPIA